MKQYDIIVVGGGLAGLTAAVHLGLAGFGVLVLEKHSYPRHKVCGEYLSNEVAPYLHSLGIELAGAANINTLRFSTPTSSLLYTSLPIGGMGISRYFLDNTLYNRALALGVDFVFETVKKIDRQGLHFRVYTGQECHTAPVVIGAHGKRSGLDRTMKRKFMDQASPWLAVKAHYKYEAWPDEQVGLHTFPGGYAGLSKTETGVVNFCYLASYNSFQPVGQIHSFTHQMVAANPQLNSFLQEAQPLFEEPLSIAQISFRRKKCVENGVIMCGDSAGMIHPLCGNGMAMAIHSAKLAADLVIRYFGRKGTADWEHLAKSYRAQWNKVFSKRLIMGRGLQQLLLNRKLSGHLATALTKSPWLVGKIIRATHGKTIRV